MNLIREIRIDSIILYYYPFTGIDKHFLCKESDNRYFKLCESGDKIKDIM